MTPRESPALLQALALLDNPRGSRPGPAESLPTDILGLLRIAAGDQERVATAASNSGLDQESIRDAAVFYIQQVLFASGSDSYRTLGVDGDAADAQLREHHRWLLRWLHPDRNTDPWEAVYAARVGGAWQDLRNAERRRAYDQREPAAPLAAAVHPLPLAPRLFDGPLSASAPSASLLRWLPGLVLGILGLSAVLAVGLLYAMHAIDAREASALAQAQPPAETRPEASVALRMPETISAPIPVTSVAAPARPQAEAAPHAPAPPERSSQREAATLGKGSSRTAAVLAANATPTTEAPLPPARVRPRNAAVNLPPSMRTSPILTSSMRTLPIHASPQPSRPAAVAVVAAATIPPAATPSAPVSLRVAPLPGLDDVVANNLVGDFSESYRRGDLGRMQALLTDDARSAGGARGSLIAEYGTLFAASERRRLTIRNVSWFINGDTASIIASYEASVQMRRGGRPRQSRGDLRLDLRLDEGQWRIYRLAHDDHPG